jgi:hypothetical protein
MLLCPSILLLQLFLVTEVPLMFQEASSPPCLGGQRQNRDPAGAARPWPVSGSKQPSQSGWTETENRDPAGAATLPAWVDRDPARAATLPAWVDRDPAGAARPWPVSRTDTGCHGNISIQPKKGQTITVRTRSDTVCL